MSFLKRVPAWERKLQCQCNVNIHGFVLVVPKKNTKLYREMAQFGKKLMKPLSFTKLAKPKAGETVWFSFITYKSKKHRDVVNAKVMNDPIMKDPKWKDMPMPFDMKRMAYGGFKVMVG